MKILRCYATVALIAALILSFVVSIQFIHPVLGDWTGTHFDNRSNAEKLGWGQTEVLK